MSENLEPAVDEIERKWLLKNLPQTPSERILFIEQYYIGPKRYRKTAHVAGSDPQPMSYECIIKTMVDVGEFKEQPFECNKEIYEFNKKMAERIIIKYRHLYYQDDLKFEIDLYQSIKLITLEVEIPWIGHNVTIPEFIQAEIIAEVTGLSEFSNYSLAKKLK